MAPNTGDKINRLKTGELILIADWMRKNKETIISKRPTHDQFSVMVYEGTGIRMNPKPASRLAAELGITWDTPGKSRSQTRVDLAQVQNDLRLIARMVCMLCEKSDMHFDESDIDSMMEISTRPRSNGN